jgi:formylglycine-generating enzyme required for sulfatase activity
MVRRPDDWRHVRPRCSSLRRGPLPHRRVLALWQGAGRLGGSGLSDGPAGHAPRWRDAEHAFHRVPSRNIADDGYLGTTTATAYQPNGYGLYNVAGNVWAWCAEWWATTPSVAEGSCATPARASPCTARVLRGGSYLCHDSYCNRYRVAACTSGNTGFRVAWNTPSVA